MQDNNKSRIIRILSAALAVALVFGLFTARLIRWQLIKGEDFLAESRESSSNYTILQAARGEILDSSGNPMIVNKSVYNVVFDASRLRRADYNDTIYKLILLMEECGEEWIDRLPIRRLPNGGYAFKEDSEAEIEYMKSASMLHLNDYATAEDCVKTMFSDDYYDISGYPAGYDLKIASVRYNMHRSAFSVRYPYTFAEDLSIEAVTVINENRPNLPGVSVEVGTIREYPASSLAPHIIGYIGALNAEEYSELLENGKIVSAENYTGYSYNDKIGKSGIEFYLEDELRGKNGKKTIVYSPESSYVTVDDKTIDPVSGHTVYLTLDSNLQEVTNESLARNVEAAQANGKELYQKKLEEGKPSEHQGEDCTAGAVVVLDAKTFGVKAMSTYPTYDLVKSLSDADYYTSLLAEESNTPLVNRATMGTYTPGSIFKPAIALAGLQEGSITSETEFHCSGLYNNPDFVDYHPTCMGIHNDTNVTTALQKSCNVFFYELGYRIGIRTMNVYCSLLGLGTTTGIEIGEREGILAGPDEYNLYHSGESWTDGLTVMAAIGQSDNSFTPLQLAAYCATIANDGVRLNTHIIEKITDYSRENVLYTTPKTALASIGVEQRYLNTVKAAMALVCEEGGTASRFKDYGVKIAAKTGTATTNEETHSDNATFIAFAPYEDPEIAVAIVLEYGAKATYVQNIAEDVFDAYFYKKTAAELFPDLPVSQAPSSDG